MPHGLSSLRPSSLRKRQQCRVFARLRASSRSKRQRGRAEAYIWRTNSLRSAKGSPLEPSRLL